jgi:hypothetical protein
MTSGRAPLIIAGMTANPPSLYDIAALVRETFGIELAA